MEFTRPRLLGSGRVNPFDNLFDCRAIADVDYLVGIRDAKINSIAGFELVADNFFSVYKSAVTAARILQYQLAVDDQYLRLVAADAAIAQRELVSSLPADSKRRGTHYHIAAHAVGFDDDESLAARHLSVSERRVRAATHSKKMCEVGLW